jgi:hypothetical protein
VKIVINACFGGFSLSDEGTQHYAKLKGMTLYPEEHDHSYVTFWTVPEAERVKPLPGLWVNHPIEVRAEYNRKISGQTLYCRDIPRDDPELVRTVEDLGEAANGSCAELKIVEVPDGTDWEISEYDGNEHVAQKHETWY